MSEGRDMATPQDLARAIHQTKPACPRCNRPVKSGSDYLRANRWGRCLWIHCQCWIAQLRENEQRTS